jgi:very-short-patch-repair endonuclease
MDKGYARPTLRARTIRNNATDAERVLWQAISARKLAGIRFNRQVPIGPFICDFVARSIRLVIEVDGGQHDASVDAGRTAFLKQRGYRVLRFWNNDVLGNLDRVAAQIERVISAMMTQMPSPNPSRQREGSFCGEGT